MKVNERGESGRSRGEISYTEPMEPKQKALLKDIVIAHGKWVASDGKEGIRAELRKADLQEADLHDANLQKADLEGASLSVADLMRTNFRFANLRKCDFWMADMKDTNLEGAELQGADLTDATSLTQDQVDLAITDEHTKLPGGLRRR